MNQAERQQQIINVLLNRGNETVENLSFEFQVSRRTILNDLEILSLTYPIETKRGRYGGGVSLANWYRPSRKVLSEEQVGAIEKAAQFLEGTDRQTLLSILTQFSVP